MEYYWFKAFHIIGVVVWFAGLFYLVRLFVYHAEANEEQEPKRTILKNQYMLMEKRLYNIITTPGMFLTVIMAMGIVSTDKTVLQSWWLHIKLLFVGLLVIYHYYCGRIIKQLEQDTCLWTGKQFRMLNEAPTILLVSIVLLVIFKDNLPLDYVTLLLIMVTILLVVSIQLYAKKRRLSKESKV